MTLTRDEGLHIHGPATTAALSTFAVSVILHTLGLVIFLVAGVLSVGTIREPDPSLIFVGTVTRPPAPPPPAPLPPRAASANKTDRSREIVQLDDPAEMIQPTLIPEQIPEYEIGEDDSGYEEGFEDGVDEGLPGGLPGGSILGVPGGHVDGVPNGIQGGIPGGPAGPGGTGEALPILGEIRPPVIRTRVEPAYPPTARRARAEGKVILEVVVGPSGVVEDVRVLRSAPLFDEAAVSAVREWEYLPALQNGRPVRVYMTVVVEFKLQ